MCSVLRFYARATGDRVSGPGGAAEKLGIPARTLDSKIKRLRINKFRFKDLYLAKISSELRKGAKAAVPLADRAIGNLQQWLIGTYHGVSKPQPRVYLDEFVFRHNRRKSKIASNVLTMRGSSSTMSTPWPMLTSLEDVAVTCCG
jgi:hypothetical protein